MPGIVGLITRMPRERAVPELLRMVEALRHEPFYEVGTWVDEALGVYVGWTVRKPSPADAQAIRTEGGDVVLVLSGEAVADAPRLDHDGNASAFLAGLNGRFHGLLADR